LHTNGTFLGTHSSGSLGTAVTVTSLSNAGHASTFPLTTGTLCQTNMTGTCGTNSGVTSITGTAHNVTASASTGPVTLNTGDNVVVTGGSAQTIAKGITHTADVTMSGANINMAGNRIKTTQFEVFDPNVNNGRLAKYLQVNNTSGANTPTIIDMFPGTSNLSTWFEFNRLQPPATTNYEVLRVGTDTLNTGEYELQAD